ncbi:MAG TPA: PAS domain S-box protein [Actinobacteria bacterium]|nr:PAS domain S-box protein [Actinomycetota bacterium]
MHEGTRHIDSGESASSGPHVTRGALRALLRSMALPAVMLLNDGTVAVHNAAAAAFLTPGPQGIDRMYLHDGTDLWTIISARADEAAPFFDVRTRMRVADGQVVDITFMVAPLRGAQGALAGAMVLALDALGTRVRELAVVDVDSAEGALESLVERLGRLTSAAHTYVIELEPGFGAEAEVLASWSSSGPPVPLGPFDARNTPSESFTGRRFLCVPEGLRDAYPDEPFFEENACVAYAGTVLLDPAGEQIGILAGLWRQPLEDVAGVSAAFAVTAVAASRMLVARLAQRNLREIEQRYSAVFEGSAVPIVLIDPDTTQIIDANPAACEFYGYARDDLMAMSVLQTDALSAEMVRTEIERAATGQRVHFASKHLLSGGRVRDVDVNIGPLRAGGRSILYSMIHDITERKRMESELERAKRNLEIVVGRRTEDLLRTNAELQQASVARDMVFASLAREMRTSLQTITGFSDLLLGGMAGPLSDEQRRQVEMIREAGRQLSGFSASLLESRRSTDGDTRFEVEPFDLVDLVESIVFGLVSFAEEKGLTLDLVAEDRPLEIETDRFMVQQVLLNLLSNAIRYTRTGGVTVTVRRVGEDHCSVAVADTGPGLPPQQIETVFQGPEVHEPAAGIGLPASSRIASVLRGAIDVQSVVGEGSVFTLMLPISVTSPGKVADPEADANA